MARPFGTKYIETPDKMWMLFTEYKTWVECNPILVHDFVGKDGDSVRRERQRPLTLEGFEVWCFENNIISDLGHYFANTDDKYKDYCTICSHIRRSIRAEQITGGMAGIYNPSITQRLNNLVEKQETKHEINEIVIKRES